MNAPNELLWAFIGLLLTIGGTFIEAYTTGAPWNWGQQGLHTYSLGVTFQIGAVLLVGCLGGKNAGALSQIAYIVLGLAGVPIFTQGGGLSYLQEPTFGYLLGFIPGAWVCGFLAFKVPLRLESLAFSCVSGLLAIHVVGLGYLGYLGLTNALAQNFWQAALQFSVYALPGQLAVACAATVLAFALRHLMFY